MNFPTKSLNDGFTMPVLGLGTYMMGGRLTRDPSNDDQADIDTIIRAVELGVTHIDTAEIYANGHAEELLAEALSKVGRDGLFLASKAPEFRLEPESVLAACHRSLDRLQTDVIDLYMPHSFNPSVPLDETMSAFDQLADEGLIRYIGVSNFSAEELAAAQKVTKHKIYVDQVHFSVATRTPQENGLLKYCQDNDVFLNAYRPLEKKGLIDRASAALEAVAKKHNRSIAQVCLNWLLAQKNVVTLVKTSNLEHLSDDLAALEWSLDAEDMANLG